MPAIDRSRVRKAMGANTWDFSNKLLYDLCRIHPGHVSAEAVLAKILLIGRVYAAAIERGRSKDDEVENESFYTKDVVPALQSSDIDSWIAEAKSARPGTALAVSTLVKVHGLTTTLFSRISGLEKRSLASKYLHFHVPKLFYIYDSRAVQGLREFSPVLPRASRSSGVGDNEYRKFAEKCDHLRQHCQAELSLRLSPRQLDNLLLRVNEK